MFLHRLLRGKLTSFLQPWLQQHEPHDLELELGLINSKITLNNLTFNSTALNRLLDDKHSLFSVKELTVEEISLRFSNWSAPAFEIEVRGINVILLLTAAEEEERSSVRAQEKKKAVAAIDPEGSALHDVLEKILTSTQLRNRFTTSLLNLVLNHSHLQVFDTKLQVQFSVLNDDLACSFELDQFNGESRYFGHGCLFREFIGVVLKPLKETSITLDFRGFGVAYEIEDKKNSVFSSVDMFSSIKLSELQMADFTIRVPELRLLLSPFDLLLLTVFDKLTLKKPKCIRNGRQLWRLAANRLGYVISSPKFSLHSLVEFVCMWLRYLNAYEQLLSLLGYAQDNLLKRPAIEMLKDKISLSAFKENWELISCIEKDLPHEAIAQARRIARYRATLKIRHCEDNCDEYSIRSHLKVLFKILSLLVLTWNFIHRLLFSIMHAFLSIKFSLQEPIANEDLGIVSGDRMPHFRFLLNFGKVLVTFCPANMVQNVNEKLESRFGISFYDVNSFCLSADALLLAYTDEIFEHSLSISCGKIRVKSYSFTEATVMGSSLEHHSVRGNRKRTIDNSKTVLWGEPAQSCLPLQTSQTNAAEQNESSDGPLLKTFLAETWLSWVRACKKYDGNEIEYSEKPWLLCEIKNYLIHPSQNDPNSGLWKCNMAVGKLNITLGYISIFSMAILLGQIQHALKWTNDNGKANVDSHSTSNFEDQLEISLEDKYENCIGRMKMALPRMVPEKNIQLGVFIAGPCIQMSIGKTNSNSGKKGKNFRIEEDDPDLRLNIKDVEAVVWPTLKSDLALSPLPEFDDAEAECHRLQEPHTIEILKADNEKYASQMCVSLRSYLRIDGLIVYVRSSTEIHERQILVLKPVAVQLSYFRECVHLFCSTVIAFSAALCGRTTGFTVISYMDELHAFFQVGEDLFSAVSYASEGLKIIGYASVQDFMRQLQLKAFSEPDNNVTTAEGAPLIHSSTMLSINGTFNVKSIDVILQSYRMNHRRESSNEVNEGLRHQNCPEFDLLDHGIWASVHRANVDMSYEMEKVDIHFNLSEFQLVVFKYQDLTGKCFDQLVIRHLQQKSHNWLCELCLSNLTSTLSLYPHEKMTNSTDDPHLDSNISNILEDIHSITDPETSYATSISENFSVSAPTSSHWIFISVTLGGIFVGRHSVKNILVEAHQFRKLTSLLSVGRNLRTISWRMQGGHVFLETTTLMIFIRCLSTYMAHFRNLISIMTPSIKEVEKAEHESRGISYATKPLGWKLPEASRIDVCQFSLVLAIEENSGELQQLVTELDIFVKLELANMQKKFKFELSRMLLYSQVLKDSDESKNHIPGISSIMSNASASQSTSTDPSVSYQHMHVSDLSQRSYILNHLVAVISVEKSKCPQPLNQVWIGTGSVSGFHATVSLSEIRMLSSMVSSVSGEYDKDTTIDQKTWTSNQESDYSLADMVADGAIVAIQDMHQHLYFAVEGGESKYSLTGVIHYSLAGERALFMVKHHKQKMWNSSVLWFSLISLHAKNDSGEPFRLSYRPGSGFVDICSTNISGSSLWRTFSCRPDHYDGGIDWEPFNNLVKKKFYLINRKNDCGVAFLDGTPEFVRKPGNLFKFKVFHDHTFGFNVKSSDGYHLEPSGANLRPTTHEEEEQNSHIRGKLPCVHIKIYNSDLTIVHELLDTKDRCPLLRAFIKNTEINVQILSKKTRVMSTSCALLHCFDAQRNSWRQLVHPIEICTFYRSNSQYQGSEIHQDGVPVHLYCRIKKLDISLTELSLDVLLFLIGKLDLAGPFAVKYSTVLANCCKVENQSSLDLICSFYDNKRVTLASKQFASVFLRQPILEGEPPEVASSVTIQLSNLGSFVTSPLHLSLSNAQTLAWRTRITSLSDSGSYPGPFVVVDISRTSEDGLSVVVSPLTRIHNETEFPMELRFRRPQENEDVFATMLLKKGDSVDDSTTTFDAIELSGESKKALLSLSVGNFLFSFRPEIMDGLTSSKSVLSVKWSDELKGGKAVRLSGIFDKLGYKVRRALSIESVKCSFSTAHCTLVSEDTHVTNLHFLIQRIGRDVPIILPDKSDGSESRQSAITIQEQKEIFLLPTVRVSNLLHSEIHVLLTETDLHASGANDNVGKQATIACGSTADFYANPALLYFTVTLTAFRSSCKPVNSGDWMKKLLKNKNDVQSLDIDLDFCGGKYFALLRLSRGFRGVLEAAIFTPYSLRNNSNFSLLFFAPNQKLLSRDEVRKHGSSIPPDLGLLCPPNSIKSWFLKSHKMRLKLLEDLACEVLLDLDALSGPTEISLEVEERVGLKYIAKFGISMGPSSSKVGVPSQTVTLMPRNVVFNESKENINMRQCYLEDAMADPIHIKSKQQTVLRLQKGTSTSKEFSVFEKIIKKHRNDTDTSLVYIQFQLNQPESSWSGPVCIASLGCFFLKFRRQSNQVSLDKNAIEFAAVHVIEEGSTLGLHFHKPPNVDLPYRILNHLNDASLTYYQKDSPEQEVLGSGSSAFYVWDDMTLPRKLVVLINDMHLLREINLDKIRAWKPFLKQKQNRGLTSHSLFNLKSRDPKTYLGQSNSMDIVKVGYEVYAQGPTRVLRICEFSRSQRRQELIQSCAKIQLRVLHFATHLLECGKQDLDKNEEPCYAPLIVARLGNINLDSVYTDRQKYNQITVQSLNVDEKWLGAPFAAMIRRHQIGSIDSNASVLKVVCVLLSTSSNVRQVEYSSIILQPIDLNVDEDTLMRISSFWRTSLSDSTAPSQRYYFDHFEVHPIKIIANFLPGDSYSSYDSAQETLRSLLHSVVKVPPIKNMVVELNGVLVTHALITIRELLIRCAQHYSWYATRAIYIAKGSPFLPPAFVSIFDDLASSSLDVFFDPSRGLINLPGFTLGTFKFLSRCIGGKGLSGTKRYFGDLEKTLRTVGSNVMFAAVTEISDSVLRGAETSGFDGMMSGFRQGILKLAMEPSLLGAALMEGGPDRKIKLDRNPGIDELYIEGYLQAMLDAIYRQEYLRVRVIDDQVLLKNLPPNSALIDEIMNRVKAFLVSKALLKGENSASSRPLRHLRGESEWRIGPTVLTLCEHLFVSFAIRILRKQTGKVMANVKWKKESRSDNGDKAIVRADPNEQEKKVKFIWKWGIGKFVLSGILAYIDGRLCRGIPNPVARRIVSGYLLSFLDRNGSE